MLGVGRHDSRDEVQTGKLVGGNLWEQDTHAKAAQPPNPQPRATTKSGTRSRLFRCDGNMPRISIMGRNCRTFQPLRLFGTGAGRWVAVASDHRAKARSQAGGRSRTGCVPHPPSSSQLDPVTPVYLRVMTFVCVQPHLKTAVSSPAAFGLVSWPFC